MPYQSKHSKERQKLIASYEDQKSKRIKTIQRAFRVAVTSYLISSLDTDGGNIKDTIKNYTILAGLSGLQREFEAVTVLPFLRWVARSANKLLSANNRYFTDAPDTVKDKVKRAIQARLGIQNGDNIRKGGFLSTVGDTTKVFNDIKALATRTVSDRSDTKELTQAIKIYDEGAQLVQDFENKSIDLFPVVDRDAGERFRNELGLRHAIYQGGIIKTSRPFCIERNNKVFTVEEIASWALLDFQGKSNPYNPFKDCGGYNCRHQLDWISDELAYKLRPDLKQ
jgi:hypothetical protein